METLTVSELAAAAGVNAQTIRYYEGEGLLAKPPRTSGGYRAFPPDAADRVRFIKRAQELGFSLEEVKELLDLREHPEAACPEVLKRAQSKLAEMAEKVRHLQTMMRELTRLVKACAGRARPHACPLLEALDTPANAEKKSKKSGATSHDHTNEGDSSVKRDGPVEPRRRGAGGSRRLDLLHRSAGAAGAGRRRRMGQQPEAT